MAYRREFGDAVREAIAGRPYRTIASEAGEEELSPAYIADMVQGRIPKREKVLALARGCRLDAEGTNRLLSLAGYATLEPRLTPQQRLGQELTALGVRYDIPNLTVRRHGG